MNAEADLANIPSIPHLVGFASDRYGSRLAIDDGAERLSYLDLERTARSVAKALIADGIVHGERVAIWAPNSARWIAAALGIHMAGAILVPLNTRLKGREAGWILRKSGVRVLLTVRGFLGIDYVGYLRDEVMPALRKTYLIADYRDTAASDWEAFLAGGERTPAESLRERLHSVNGGDCSDLVFTSGTTGVAKGVVTTHGQNLNAYRTYSRNLGLNDQDRYLLVNPFFNSFGYKAGWLSALMRGSLMLPQAVFDPVQVLARIERDRVTVLPGPPTLYQELLAASASVRFDRSSLRLAVTGAASIPTTLVRAMRFDLGFQTVLTAYGLTETCGVVSMCAPSDDLEIIATTSGRVVEGMEVRVVGDTNQSLPAGTPGEIQVRGINVMQGYFDEPDETHRAIDSEGWLQTGDIGVVTAEGYIKITDRKKDVFIVGGFNCYPAEIENILLSHPSINRAAVVGMPDTRLGEAACAFVIVRAGVSLTSEEVIAWSRENMANYKVPRRVEFVDSLPVNASGKVQRFALRAGMPGNSEISKPT